ncbi:MAG: transposase [Magnetococcales bacterium]|nr:transposase [Magnetococcales bacterium]
MDRLILRDDQWERIEKELPGKVGDPGKTAENNRLFVEGVLWIDRTGSPWRDLPTLFGNWNSAYQRFNRWSKKGIWNRLKEFVSVDPDLEEFLIDGSIIRVHQPILFFGYGSWTEPSGQRIFLHSELPNLFVQLRDERCLNFVSLFSLLE